MRPRKLTDAHIVEMIDLRERGWGYARLAAHFGVSTGAIHYQCLKHGAISPRQHRYGRGVYTVSRREFVASDGRTQRRFMPEEDSRLLDLEGEGLSYREIARRIGRPLTSVRIRLMTLAQHDEIACEDAGG